MNQAPTLWVVLPALNEAPALSRMAPRVEGLSKKLPGLQVHVVLVDDGSIDGTERVLQEYAPGLPSTVIRHESNQGFGAALWNGLLHVIRRGGENDVIVTLDADDSQSIEEIPALVKALEDGADVAIASRFVKGSKVVGVPSYRRILSRGASLVGRLILRVPGVRDYTCNFRAYRWEVLKQLSNSKGELFALGSGFEAAMQLLTSLAYLPSPPHFTEIPFVLRYDLKPGASKMRLWRTVFRTLNLVWNLRGKR